MAAHCPVAAAAVDKILSSPDFRTPRRGSSIEARDWTRWTGAQAAIHTWTHQSVGREWVNNNNCLYCRPIILLFQRSENDRAALRLAAIVSRVKGLRTDKKFIVYDIFLKKLFRLNKISNTPYARAVIRVVIF